METLLVFPKLTISLGRTLRNRVRLKVEVREVLNFEIVLLEEVYK
jgi:hypothetical protein